MHIYLVMSLHSKLPLSLSQYISSTGAKILWSYRIQMIVIISKQNLCASVGIFLGPAFYKRNISYRLKRKCGFKEYTHLGWNI